LLDSEEHIVNLEKQVLELQGFNETHKNILKTHQTIASEKLKAVESKYSNLKGINIGIEV
jgi:hypothetical protein